MTIDNVQLTIDNYLIVDSEEKYESELTQMRKTRLSKIHR